MPRLGPALLLVALQGCAAPASQVCPTVVAPGAHETSKVAAVAPRSSAHPAPPPARGALCYAGGRPAAETTKATDGACQALDAAELSRVEAEVRRRFVIHEKPSRLFIDFGCDRAGSEITDVVLEDGSGHGGSLRLAHIRRDGARAVVRRIGSSHYYSPGLVIQRAEITSAVLDKLIARSRVPLLVKPHLVRLQTPNSIGELSFTFSSNNYHLRLRFADDESNVTERAFTGYESSAEQEHTVPMQMATEPWEKMLDALSFTDVPITDEDRRFFRERFLDTMRGAPAWWVEERFVADAATLGTIDLVPTLAALIPRQGDASKERVRELAVDAIAAITGWNPRVDPNGVTRTPDEAAAAVVDDCLPGPTAAP